MDWVIEDYIIFDWGVGQCDQLQWLWIFYWMNYLVEVLVKCDFNFLVSFVQLFIEILQLFDEEGLVVVCGKLVYVVFNLYLYNFGYLMVVFYCWVFEFEDFIDLESVELMVFIQKVICVIKNVLCLYGFNVGLNLGILVGGLLVEYLYVYVVLWWGGDVNFIIIIGGFKVILQLLCDICWLFVIEWVW